MSSWSVWLGVGMRFRRLKARFRTGPSSRVMLTAGGRGGSIPDIDMDAIDGLALQRDPLEADEVVARMFQGTPGTVGHIQPTTFPGSVMILKDVADTGALWPLLATWTQTPNDVWACVWEGYGGLGKPPRGVRLVDIGSRRYFAYRGPISRVAAMASTGIDEWDIVWPSDRAWMLSSDTDYGVFVLGGSEAAICAIEAVADLRATRVTSDDRAPSIEETW